MSNLRYIEATLTHCKVTAWTINYRIHHVFSVIQLFTLKSIRLILTFRTGFDLSKIKLSLRVDMLF